MTKIAVKNLYRNKIRNSLTLFGVAIGISVFVSSLSLSSGFKNQIYGIIKKYSIDINVMAKGASTPLGSKVSFKDYHALSEVPGVRDISAIILGSVKTPWNSYFLITGISSVEALSSKINFVDGRMFIPGRREIILGKLASEKLGYGVGNKILLGENELFTVTGVFQVGSRVFDGAGAVDIQDSQRLLKRERYVNMALLQLERSAVPGKVLEAITDRFPHLTAVRTGDFIGQMRMFETIDLFAWVISAISLFTCCVVVMNTLFMAVSERTKEIGVLAAIGWSRSMIFKTLVLEALILCLMGGIAGNGLSLLTMRSLNLSTAIGMGWFPKHIPWTILFYSLSISIILGIVSALLPAMVASRLMPAEALRYE